MIGGRIGGGTITRCIRTRNVRAASEGDQSGHDDRVTTAAKQTPPSQTSGANAAKPNQWGKRRPATLVWGRGPNPHKNKRQRPHHTLPRYRCSLSGLTGFTLPSR